MAGSVSPLPRPCLMGCGADRLRHQLPWQSPSGALFFLGGPGADHQRTGFHTIEVPLAGGQIPRLAGVTPHDAAGFTSAANQAFGAHFLKQFEAAADELTALSEAIARLGQPRRYPAACLLSPFLARATTVMESLPETILDSVLSEDQQTELLPVSRTPR